MTVNTITPIVEYLEDGVTLSFPVPFRFLAAADLIVTRYIPSSETTVELILGTDYTVSGVNNPNGGSITKKAAGPGDSRLQIKRLTPRVQPMDYTANDTFPAESHELALDRGILIGQELSASVNDVNRRAIMVPFGELGGTLAPRDRRLGGRKVLAPNAVTGAIEVQPIDDTFRGLPGRAANTWSSRGELTANADPLDGSAVILGDGTFTWVTGDLTALLAAEPANFLPSSRPGAGAGAWVRIPGEGGYASLAALKLGRYTVGQAVRATVYGSSEWICRSEIILQNHFNPLPFESSKVDFDDELHLVVNLVGGGTAMLECQTSSIQGYVTNRYSELYDQVMTRLRRVSVIAADANSGAPVPGPAAAMACFGDSITFGQVPDGYPNANLKKGTPTNFGDGSVYAWNQIDAPYPSILKGLCDSVFGVNKVSTQNLGYSGDRVGNGYRRHRFSRVGQTISVIWYGTNDNLFGSNNGIEPVKLFNNTEGFEYARFTSAYRKFMYREVLRGSMPLCITPWAFKSLLGYDGSNWAAAKISQHYRMAVMSVAGEIGAGVVDAVDVFNAYAQDQVTQGDPHLVFQGCYAIAAAIMPFIMGNGFRDPTRISGTRKLSALAHIDNVAGPGAGATDLTFVNNTNSLGQSWETLGSGADIIIDASARRFWTFYLEEDETAIMPVCLVPAGSALTWQLDFGALAPQAKLNTRRGATAGQYITYPNQASVDNNGGTGNKVVNHPGSSTVGQHLVVRGRGWHSLQLLASGPVIVSGILFGRFGDMGAAIAAPTGGTTIDAEARTAINSILATLRDQNIIKS